MSRKQSPDGTVVARNRDTGDFFSRHGLPPIETRGLCWDFIKTKYSDGGINIENHDLREAPNQGFCSYTIFLDSRPETIVQFRPRAHELNLDIIHVAREIYGELVAVTELIGSLSVGKAKQVVVSPTPTNSQRNYNLYDTEKTPDRSLLVYSLSRIRGMSLAELYTATYPHPTIQCHYQYRESLVRSLAAIISRGLLSSPSQGHSVSKGPVGGTIRHRLGMMRRELPTRFRPTVDTILDALPRIEALPWVLTHGDLVPSNVIIDFCSQPTENSGPTQLPAIKGLIDWAEAEFLPFGVGIYGLEEFLGVQVPIPAADDEDDMTASILPSPSPTPPPTDSNIATAADAAVANNGKKYPPPGSRFRYFSEAESLRSLFWRELEASIRGAENAETPLHKTTDDEESTRAPIGSFLETVRLARTLGILLWHGIAFDDGRLDRVVCEGRDDEEIHRLDMHLHLQSGKKEKQELN